MKKIFKLIRLSSLFSFFIAANAYALDDVVCFDEPDLKSDYVFNTRDMKVKVTMNSKEFNYNNSARVYPFYFSETDSDSVVVDFGALTGFDSKFIINMKNGSTYSTRSSKEGQCEIIPKIVTTNATNFICKNPNIDSSTEYLFDDETRTVKTKTLINGKFGEETKDFTYLDSNGDKVEINYPKIEELNKKYPGADLASRTVLDRNSGMKSEYSSKGLKNTFMCEAIN
jgi:hypothetical protein